ncbi:hypothetical protein AMTRI_Chr03g44910 [Amborella trichopoda]
MLLAKNTRACVTWVMDSAACRLAAHAFLSPRPMPWPPFSCKHVSTTLAKPTLRECNRFLIHYAAKRRDASSWTSGIGEAVNEVSSDKFLNVVLFSPQIPGNTGCVARTCAASAVGLHLIEPLGFQVDDTKLKRAGLDYWPYVVVKIHKSWEEFLDYFGQQKGEKRLLAFTKKGTRIHTDFEYKRGDWLVFGSETSGLPQKVHQDCQSGEYGGGTIQIPMVETYVRCLNLSVSVGIAIYEAYRQLGYEQLGDATDNCVNGDRAYVSEDIFV